MYKKLAAFVSLFFILSAFLGACTTTTPTTEEAPPTAVPAATAKPGEPEPTEVPVPTEPVVNILTRPMVMCSDLEAVTVDPHANDYAYSSNLQFGPYESLFEWGMQSDGTWGVSPVLATAYEISDDGLEYTFHLREGITFHDGTPFNADAVLWNFDRLKALASQPSTKIFKLSELVIEAVDDYSVKITLPEAYPPFIYAFNDQPMMISPTAAEANEVEGDFGDHGDYAQGWLYDSAVGTGPYFLSEWLQGESATLIKNPDYWGGWEGNFLESIVVRVVGEVATRKLMLQGGECDLTLRMSETDIAELKADQNIVIFEGPATQGLTIQIRPHGPFADVRVRQAVALAFDYDAFANNVLLGTAQIANSPLTPGVLYWDPTLPPFEQDLDRARELLVLAGYSDGVPGEFEMWTIPSFQYFLRSQAELLQANLAEIGITISIVEYGDAAPLLAGIFDGNVENEPTFFPWTFNPLTVHPDSTLRQHYHTDSIVPNGVNGAFYSNSRVDELLAEGLVATDPTELQAIYEEIQAIIVADQPFLWLGYPLTPYWHSTELKGFTRAPLADSYVNSWRDLWLEGE